MKKNTNLTGAFFKNLGELFYAIAVSDKKVETIEINTLKEIIKLHWAKIDYINPEALKQLMLRFNELNKEENPNIEKLFLDFICFKNQEKHLFTRPIKILILETANAIASSFSGRNKSELILLAKLEIELKKEQ